jgi:hypothetical protein
VAYDDVVTTSETIAQKTSVVVVMVWNSSRRRYWVWSRERPDARDIICEDGYTDGWNKYNLTSTLPSIHSSKAAMGRPVKQTSKKETT